MNRRKFTIGLASLAAGSAAAIGTGAFTSVEADRGITVDVASDAEAFLGLEPTDKPNGDYAELDDELLVLNFDGSAEDVGGKGFNPNSTTVVDDVFTATNQGTQDVGVSVEFDIESDADVDIDFVAQTATDPDGQVLNDESNDSPVLLGVGESFNVGLEVDVTSEDTFSGVIVDDEITILADAAESEGSSELAPVRNASTGDTFETLGDALDAVSEGETIQVLTGTEFAEDVDIDTPDVTLEATSNTKPLIEGQVDLSAEGTTLDGFGVSPNDPATGTLDNEAIRVTASNTTVTGNTVTDFPQDFDGFGELIGIVASNPDGDAVQDVSISENEVIDLQPEDVDEDSDVAAVGISIAGNVNAAIDDNTVSNVGGDEAFYAWGIVARETGDEVPEGVNLTGNRIEDVTSADGFDQEFFGVGFGWDVEGADASVLSAIDNSIDTPELLVENKDPENEIDATGNWWGSDEGADEERIFGGAPIRSEVDEVVSDSRGPVNTDDPLDSDPN
ncbi:MAG: DUF1102 domain-containing protein [Halorubrum sp.]